MKVIVALCIGLALANRKKIRQTMSPACFVKTTLFKRAKIGWKLKPRIRTKKSLQRMTTTLVTSGEKHCWFIYHVSKPSASSQAFCDHSASICVRRHKILGCWRKMWNSQENVHCRVENFSVVILPHISPFSEAAMWWLHLPLPHDCQLCPSLSHKQCVCVFLPF